MSELHSALNALLTRFISPIIAQGILKRALREQNLDPLTLDRIGLQAVSPRLETAVRLFMDPESAEAFRAALLDLAGAPIPLESKKLSIKTERDLTDALSETRRLCQHWRMRAISQQKVATVVSELARNIVNYTPGGTVELIPLQGHTPRVLVRATDTGNGIPNLDQILEGRYRSKTGLGKGLLGTKRLSDRFEVRSGRSGTVVEAELKL
jgi:serine/threonine-protein kinase RsbT